MHINYATVFQTEKLQAVLIIGYESAYSRITSLKGVSYNLLIRREKF